MKEFTTAAKAVAASNEGVVGEVLVAKVDGREVTFNPPTEGQMAVLLAASAGLMSDAEAAANIINFFFSLVGDDDSRYLRQKLFHSEDPFGLEEIKDITMWLIEEWSGRPTKSPSDFMPSRQAGGPKSTQRRPRVAASIPST